MVGNPHFVSQKREGLDTLTTEMIDKPIAGIVAGFNHLSCCFTLQSCYGHFLFPGQDDPFCCDPLPETALEVEVEYKIAYLAFCLQDSDQGKRLLDAFRDIPLIDPDQIQFCSPEWFWDRQVNSYALQVEPDRFKHCDTAIITFEEALRLENVRNKFFQALKVLSGSPRL